MTAELIVLGASNAIPTLESQNTHLALRTAARTVLIDVAANPLVRLEQAGLDCDTLTDVILTHFHPDHVSGLASFLMDLWLTGRSAPLMLRGLGYTLERAEKMLALYEWQTWRGMFPVEFNRVPEQEQHLLLDAPDLRIYSSPVRHLLPNIGLRIEFRAENKVLAYSSDTEPCPAVVQLARDVDVLLHEASGPFRGHTSAAQAGETAQQAGAGALYLIHYPTGRFASGDPVAEARESFSGPVTLAHDLMRIMF